MAGSGSSAGQRIAATQEGRALLQERIALYCKTMFWVVGPMFLLALAAWWIVPEMRAAQPRLALAAGVSAQLVILGAWVYTRRRRVPGTLHLRVADAVVLLAVATALALGAYAARHSGPNVWTSFLFCAFLILARVPIVPSSGARTFWLGLAAWTPMMAVGTVMALESSRPIDMPRLVFVSGMLGFVVAAQAIATLGSHVIYGLRREVRKARRLGQYHLEAKLGEGGMGIVYRGSHAMLRRPAAIKLLHPDRAGTGSLRRFEREVRLTAQLTHPNTVAVYDYGRSPGGVFYYVMEYLEGIDLDTLVRDDGPQPAGRVIHVLRQVCGALGEAHELGLIHRDIKPANIILCERGGVADVAKVVDFGLAKQISADEIRGASSELSMADAVAGTPTYLAPETITTPEEVGPRVDIYSLGAVGYFLLTGQPVFEGETVVELCSHHALTEPTPPSQRVDGGVPADLEALLLRCLAKRPADRPAGAVALAAELAALADADTWTQRDAAAWWSRWRAAQASTVELMAPVDQPVSPFDLTIDLSGRGVD